MKHITSELLQELPADGNSTLPDSAPKKGHKKPYILFPADDPTNGIEQPALGSRCESCDTATWVSGLFMGCKLPADQKCKDLENQPHQGA